MKGTMRELLKPTLSLNLSVVTINSIVTIKSYLCNLDTTLETLKSLKKTKTKKKPHDSWVLLSEILIALVQGYYLDIKKF